MSDCEDGAVLKTLAHNPLNNGICPAEPKPKQLKSDLWDLLWKK
jgi:hypothetical protein